MKSEQEEIEAEERGDSGRREDERKGAWEQRGCDVTSGPASQRGMGGGGRTRAALSHRQEEGEKKTCDSGHICRISQSSGTNKQT